MRPIFAAACIGFTFALAARNSAHAEQEELQGTYTVDSVRSESIDSAIEQGIADMNFVIRPIARNRLAKTNPRYERIVLSRNDSTVSVQFDARKPIEMPADGHAVPWTREDGSKYEVNAQCSATQLVMHFKAEDGERVNTFALDPDGRSLKLNVKVTSPKLPKPVTYTLAYRREVS